MLQKILLCFVITCFSFPVAKGGMFSSHCSLELFVLMYSLLNCSVNKNSEVSYVLNDTEMLVCTAIFLRTACSVVSFIIHFSTCN
jgi:hypothetical protein